MTPPASGSAEEPVRALRHALRTPVNHIVGYGELLLEDAVAGGAAELVSGLQEIAAAGRKALALIDEIVGSAASGAGAPEPSRAGEALVALAGQIGSRSATLLAGIDAGAAAAADLQKIATAAQELAALVAQQVPSLARGEAAEPGAPAPAVVLVVDDNELNREMLARRVQRLGHTVLQAEDGLRALEIMRAQPVDLALLDIMMPELDG
ncbi:MAG TPA: response regulator, partial [Dehalococcoidia bacterium]|nr:response regulator [Dehalococcoidia bacterium]